MNFLFFKTVFFGPAIRKSKSKMVNDKSKFKKDFTNYFNHSLKSANESKLWLSLLRDSKRAGFEEVD